MHHVHGDADPYRNAAELCAELRKHGSMKLTTVACDEPHPLLGGEEGGAVDQLRVVHDVFGHASLGVGFDLQSEFATWLQCRTLFSADARPAAFCELVGAVTAYITTGEKPGLCADLPPADLVAACDVDARRLSARWYFGGPAPVSPPRSLCAKAAAAIARSSARPALGE